MIKRSANREGTVTFNIEFNSPRQGNSPLRAESDAPLFSNHKLRTSFLSVRSNPNLSMELEDNRRNNQGNEVRSIASEFDCLDLDDLQISDEPFIKFYQGNENGDNMKTNVEDFFTQEPIDFDDLRKFGRFDKDDEDKSSVSTLSKSSKKISKAKAGVVYKESRFKEEARIKGKRQPWQPYEDEQVIELVSKHGQSWALISSMMECRSGKQIRDRYLNKLRPDIKNDEWNNEEDQLLISLYHQLGRKWSKIATYLPGRTEGQVKNRFYSHISKRILPSSGELEHNTEGDITPPSKSNAKARNTNTSFGQSLISTQGNVSKEPNEKLFEEIAILDFNIDFPTSGNKSRFDHVFENQEFGLEDPFLAEEFGDPTDVISYPHFSSYPRRSSPNEKFLDKLPFEFQEEKDAPFQQINNNQFIYKDKNNYINQHQEGFGQNGQSNEIIEKQTISPTFFGQTPDQTNRMQISLINKNFIPQRDFDVDCPEPTTNYGFEKEFNQVRGQVNFDTDLQDGVYWTH